MTPRPVEAVGITVNIRKDQCTAVWQGEAAARWFMGHLVYVGGVLAGPVRGLTRRGSGPAGRSEPAGQFST